MPELTLKDGRCLLAAQRRTAIVEQVRARGGARLSDLALSFGVADATVRRDLDALARDGLVGKVHGGAVALSRAVSPAPGPGRPPADTEDRISAAAAMHVPNGAVIALSAGTMTYALAKRIVDLPDLTVVTNSVQIADLFVSGRRPPGSPGAAVVILTGGVHARSGALVGPVADQTIRALHVDVLFIASHGLCIDAGLSASDPAEAETNRVLVGASRRVVVLADHTAWGRAGLCTVAPLGALDLWITDSGLAERARTLAGEYVRQVQVV